MAVFYLKNETGSDIVIDDLGLHLPDGTSRVIDKNEINGYLTDDLAAEINAGNLVLSTTDVGNAAGDLISADAIEALEITSRYDRDNPHRVTFTQSADQDPNTDITAAEAETLTDGSDASALHIHDNRYYTETELSTSNPATVNIHWDNITNAPQFGALHWRPPVQALVVEAGNTSDMNTYVGAIEGDYFWNQQDDHLYRYESGVWVDQGAPIDGDRLIYRDGVSSNDYIYEFESGSWGSGIVPEDSWAVIVNDDHGGPAQYVYDSDTTSPPNWIKLADIDWGDHNSLAGRSSANAHPGEAIDYNPAKEPSGLTSTNVQDAIDEIDLNVDTIEGNLTTHISDTTNPHDVTFTQASDADPNTDISAAEAETLTDGSNADALHTHDADNIVYDNSTSGLTATDVQAAIDEIMESGASAPGIFVYVDKNRTDTYVEDGSPGQPYKTIAAATAAITGPATIYVGEGTYNENVVLPNDVSLWGIGIGKTTINGNITTGTSPNCTMQNFASTGNIDINCTSAAQNIYTTGSVDVSQDLDAFNFTIDSATGTALTVTGGQVVFGSNSIRSADAIAIDQAGGELILTSVKVENASATLPTIESDTSNIKVLQTSIVNTGGGPAFDLDNGATALDPNVLADVIYYGTGTLGSATTIIEGAHDLSGTVRIPSGTSIIKRPGEQIDYDPTKEPSGLTSTNVQDAIDEIDANVDTITGDVTNHINNTNNPHTVTFTQAVTADPLTDILASEAETLTDGSNADALHTHAADAITYDDSVTNFGPGIDTVQEAIEAIDVTLDNLLPRGTSFPTVPAPTGGDLFYRTDLNLTFQYDESRSEWLSMTHMSFDWGAAVADGKYLRIHGAAATQSGYLMPRNGTILTLTAKAASGNQSKGLEIRLNNNGTTPLKSFNLSSGSYNSTTENINFSAGDYVQAFSSSVGVPARDVVVMVTVAWRE